MSLYIQTNQKVQLLAAGAPAAYAVNAADSGKVFCIPALGAGANILAITLPAAAPGLRFKFIAQGILASDATITAPAGAFIVGVLLNTTVGTINTIIKTIVGASLTCGLDLRAKEGDFIEVYCDGTYYHVTGISQVVAGLQA